MKIRRSEKPRVQPRVRTRKLSNDEVVVRELVLSADPGYWYRCNWEPRGKPIDEIKRLARRIAHEHGRQAHWRLLRGQWWVNIIEPHHVEVDFIPEVIP